MVRTIVVITRLLGAQRGLNIAEITRDRAVQNIANTLCFWGQITHSSRNTISLVMGSYPADCTDEYH